MLIIGFWFSFTLTLNDVLGLTCGVDKSPVSHVYEGLARIETYPWLGILYYPYQKKRFTTAVVLVTRQIALAAATEIDRLPKWDFRAKARVVIGHNCTGPNVGVRDYSYHPDFNRDTFSALAMIQLETDHVKVELRPICPPPTHFIDQQFFAMVLSDNCRKSRVRIHRMKYVSPEQCKTFYRRTGLDVDTMWPSHTACAKSLTGGRCVWRSGAILVIKVGMRWRLLGFGVYGPGCQAPARFLDYGMYHNWVRRSVERIGRPAITTIGKNHIVMRRTLSSVQRFGPCDIEETKTELYTDNIKVTTARKGRMIYNVSIYSDVEYSCIVFKARNLAAGVTPQIRLRRWCAGPTAMCFSYQFLEIHFFVEISFQTFISFEMAAYGREAKIILPSKAMAYVNRIKDTVGVQNYNLTREMYLKHTKDKKFPWYTKKN